MSFDRVRKLWLRLWGRYGPRRRVIVVEGDSLPSELPERDLVLAEEDGERWCVGVRCPCGCGHAIELLVIAEAKPRWDISVSADAYPTLRPSVWLRSGCKSHFHIRDGRILWCG